jgi:hypothetical protein
LAATLDEAEAQAARWWPNGAVPPAVLPELARPEHFEAIAAAVGPRSSGASVVCATDAAPIVRAIDRFVAAGYGRVYLHQIGPDQQRLADVAQHELIPHYR